MCHSMVRMGFSMVHMVSGLVQEGPSRVSLVQHGNERYNINNMVQVGLGRQSSTAYHFGVTWYRWV